MESIKFILVGFGHIGRRHATVIHEYPEAELIAICDVDPELERHELYPQGVPFYRTFEDVLSSGLKADVVSICTPNGLHIPQALLAIRSGHHVLIEKPMGLSKQACEQAIFEALQHDRQVFVVKQNRYSPPVKWLRQMVLEERLGRILNVQINCFWNRDDRYYAQRSNSGSVNWKGTKDLDGGVLFTQFSHFIDIMYWIFGDIKAIRSRLYNFTHVHNTEFPDSGTASFEFIQGGTGTINFSTSVWDRNLESSITVIGEKGSVKIGGQYMNAVEICHVQDYTFEPLPETNPPNDYGPFQGSAANHHYVIENVVRTLNGRDRITANMLEGMKVVEIIERIHASALE